mmetsp:Transcript_35258/g.34263  ORF Transcript_35258/g.34263 Transcript_35258/m.34263 type:complete len:294 (+) Transcript_35258:767-1648(+)
MGLNKNLIEKKEEEIKWFKGEREKVERDFLGRAEYQESLKKEMDLRKQIEEANVTLQLLNIQVKELEDATDYYNEKKDEAQEDKKIADMKNEELRKEMATKEEIAAKRLQAKLNRDKNADVKELIAQEETVMQHNVELAGQLAEEIKKFDTLQDEKLDIEEQLRLANLDYENKKKKIEDQEAAIKSIKDDIGQQTIIVDGLNVQVEEEKKIQKFEKGDRHRKLAQMNAALKAKLHFISTNYDFTTNVKVLNTEDFRQLINSNDYVNKTVSEFVGKLDVVKDEVMKYEAQRYNE